MTVKQLKTELNKFSDDAEIAFMNKDAFIRGLYKATDVEYNDGIVEIVTDYEYIRNYEHNRWESE